MSPESTGATPKRVPTPLKVVFVGGLLTVIEAIYYIVNAEFYAGDAPDDELTTTAVIVLNLIGLAFVVGLLAYAFSVRTNPGRKSYVIIAILSLVSLITGILLANLITIVAAVIGVVRTEQSG